MEPHDEPKASEQLITLLDDADRALGLLSDPRLTQAGANPVVAEWGDFCGSYGAALDGTLAASMRDDLSRARADITPGDLAAADACQEEFPVAPADDGSGPYRPMTPAEAHERATSAIVAAEAALADGRTDAASSGVTSGLVYAVDSLTHPISDIAYMGDYGTDDVQPDGYAMWDLAALMDGNLDHAFIDGLCDLEEYLGRPEYASLEGAMADPRWDAFVSDACEAASKDPDMAARLADTLGRAAAIASAPDPIPGAPSSDVDAPAGPDAPEA